MGFNYGGFSLFTDNMIMSRVIFDHAKCQHRIQRHRIVFQTRGIERRHATV